MLLHSLFLEKKSLLQLDLSHNYLRAVTTDLVVGLSSLQSLDLTDNDISSVQPGALSSLPNLVHLSLTGKTPLPLSIYSDVSIKSYNKWAMGRVKTHSFLQSSPPHSTVNTLDLCVCQFARHIRSYIGKIFFSPLFFFC